MRLWLNGEAIEEEGRSSLVDLLKRRGFPVDAVAVAVNGQVVPRRLHPSHTLVAEDRIEVIRAVGGG